MPRHRLTEDHFDAIADLFPTPARTGRPPSNSLAIVDGRLWILRTASPWRELPENFGLWQTSWDHFDKWNANGRLDSMLDRLRAAHVDVGAIDDKLWCIDGTMGRAARCAAACGNKGIPTSPKTMRWAARKAVSR